MNELLRHITRRASRAVRRRSPESLAATTQRMAALLRAATAATLLASIAAGPACAQTADAAVAMPPKAAACAACHGAGGAAPILPVYPALAGQTSRYLYLQLRDFNEGRRVNEIMTPMAAGLSRDDMRELADYFSKQAPRPQTFVADAGKAALGKAKGDENLCTMCHLGGFKGQNEVPRVAGQNFDYVVKQLGDFKARRRTNDAGTMTSVTSSLTDDDIVNIAHYLVGL